MGDEYNPFANRNVPHPTTDIETLMHLLKGSLGSGILAIPYAFKHSGLFHGLIWTGIVGFCCTYCVYMLVRSAHILLYRLRIPSLTFGEVFETAFMSGPEKCRKYSWWAHFLTNTFLVIDLYGCCCIYIVLAAKNIKQVVDYYTDEQYNIDVRLYMVLLLPPLILLNLIRHLKHLAPFSAVANILIAMSVIFTYVYCFTGLPSLDTVPAFEDITGLPIFFGTCIFALEGIGIVMPLENNMENPKHFIGCPSVLCIGYGFVITIYAMTGFFGFLKYGEDTDGSITLNLPEDEALGQSVKIMVAVAIYCTYGLQFYVPFEITWNFTKQYVKESRQLCVEIFLRILIVTITVLIAIAVPNLGGFISLVGALCLSFLGLIFPAIVELLVIYESPGYGFLKWKLWKNIFIMLFGLVGLVSGVLCSILEIIQDLTKQGILS